MRISGHRRTLSLFVPLVATALALPSLGQRGSERQAKSAPAAGSATIPMQFENNRVYLDLDVALPNGRSRKARFWVDTGGGALILAEPLAREAGLTFGGTKIRPEGIEMQASTKPRLRVGGLPLDLSSCRSFVVLHSRHIFPDSSAEGFLPPCALRHYQVVFDYPARRFTLARPGTLTLRGRRVPAAFDADTGFFRIELKVAGKSYGFLLDTGASFTMASQTLIESWEAAHPRWPRLTGAVGPANMIGTPMEANALLVRLPSAEWGPFSLRDVGVVSRPPGTFEEKMSRLTPAPVMGSLAGNVLRAFRLSVDYPAGNVYLEKEAEVNASDLDTVGIILRSDAQDAWHVTGIAKLDGRPAVTGVEVGDRLLRIGDFAVDGATLPQVLAHLDGKPGAERVLTIERGGKKIEVRAKIRRLL
jgi:hypothetical protein